MIGEGWNGGWMDRGLGIIYWGVGCMERVIGYIEGVCRMHGGGRIDGWSM